MFQSDVTRLRVLDLAQRAIHAAEPGILSVQQVAERLHKETLVSMKTVRRYMYLNFLAGHLINLYPDSAWRVTWPEAEEAGIGTIRLCVDIFQLDDKRQATRLVLMPDWQRGRVRAVGPGTVSYLTTKDYASEFVRRMQETRPA